MLFSGRMRVGRERERESARDRASERASEREREREKESTCARRARARERAHCYPRIPAASRLLPSPTPTACSTPIGTTIERFFAGAAGQHGKTAAPCERTAFTPCRRTHSAVDTRWWREEPTSTWPNRRQPVARAALQAPRHPPPARAQALRRWSSRRGHD